MCLFCSSSKASLSWRRLFLTLSSLVAIAEPVLSNMFRFSLYCFLFPSNLNSGSDLFGFSCFECLAAFRFFLIFFNSILYCFYCSSNSFFPLEVPVLSALAHQLSQHYRVSSCEIACAIPWACMILFKMSESLRTCSQTCCVFWHWTAISKKVN